MNCVAAAVQHLQQSSSSIQEITSETFKSKIFSADGFSWCPSGFLAGAKHSELNLNVRVFLAQVSHNLENVWVCRSNNSLQVSVPGFQCVVGPDAVLGHVVEKIPKRTKQVTTCQVNDVYSR